MFTRSASVVVLLITAAATGAAAAPPITAVSYSPDGTLLAAGTRGVVHIFDATTGRSLAELGGQTVRVTAVAFGPSDRLAVASGEPGRSGVVRLYAGVTAKSPAGKPSAVIPAHVDAVYAVAFSPDGTALATAGYDRTIKVWNLSAATPDARLTLTDHSDAVYGVAFHPSGKWLATASADRTVKVWDMATGTRLYTLSDPTDWVYAVAWSADGTRIFAGGTDKSIRAWTATTGGGALAVSAFAHDKAVTHLAVPASGGTLFSMGEDRIVKTWDAAKLTEVRAFPAQPETVLSFAVRPDGKQFAIGRFDGVLQLCDAATGKPVAVPLPAKPKPPTAHNLTPNAAPRGTTLRVVVEGTNLSVATGIHANVAGITGVLAVDGRTDTRLTIDLTVPSQTPTGPVQLRLTSPAGDSAAIRFWVDRFPAITEQGRTDSAANAMAVALPVTVTGSLDRVGDADYFRFHAVAGQQVGVQLLSEVDRGKFDPVVFLTDASGRVVAHGADGLLGYVCPTAGSYAVGVHDREYRGEPELIYRLHIGPVPVVTSVFPLGVRRGVKTVVQVNGVNLSPTARSVVVAPPVDAAVAGTVPVPLTRSAGDPVGRAEVAVGEFPAVTVGSGGTVQLPVVPGTVDGLLARPGESNAVRFAAKKGQPLIVEVHAARLGSPVDPFIEITDAAGHPVSRATLRCTARTTVTFRDHDSVGPAIRLEAWNELSIDDYLYVDEELVRIKSLPRGPDDNALFYDTEGKRVAFLGTTPRHHALGTPMYKVEIHPANATLPPNGMPVFRLMYRNDDGGPGYGKDSNVVFDPPVDGEYVARVRDANGEGGPAHAYRLTVRPLRPDFTIRVSPPNPKVWQGGGVPITITATRTDGFTGPITVKFDGVAPPFAIPATTIEAGQDTAVVALTAARGPTAKGPTVRVVATAEVDGRGVVREATLGVPEAVEPGDLSTSLDTTTLVIRPGTESRVRVKVERRNGFQGRVPIDVRGLPHGVRVLNVGLNGILITPNVSEREVVIYAEPWVKPTAVPIVFLARSERKGTEHAAPSVELRVQAPPR